MSVCARCPKALGASCCEVREGDRLATITRVDVERIQAATGKSADSFVEQEWLLPAECSDYETQRPLYRGYFRSETVRWSLRHRNGACVFLDRTRGCVLGESRPTACKLYPFTRFADGSWSVQVERFGDVAGARAAQTDACLAVEEANSMDEILAAFSLTRTGVESLGAQLASEAAAHGAAASPERSPRRRKDRLSSDD